MMRLKVNEAIARAESRGNKVQKKDLAVKLWAESREETAAVNMTNLCRGITKKIQPEWVVILCKELDCTADYLFGLSED